MHVDAGEWSPVIANFAISRRDASVWELWECREVRMRQLRKKQKELRAKYHLPGKGHRPREFLSDCLSAK
jgi:hypothetical protein